MNKLKIHFYPPHNFEEYLLKREFPDKSDRFISNLQEELQGIFEQEIEVSVDIDNMGLVKEITVENLNTRI